jgi:hypothetical protein
MTLDDLIHELLDLRGSVVKGDAKVYLVCPDMGALPGTWLAAVSVHTHSGVRVLVSGRRIS